MSNAFRLVYLHGFASSPASKKAQFFRRRFAEKGLEMAVPNLAADGFENLTISGQLSVVERTVEGWPALLVGSSLGGYLAALYAARHLEVRGIVLLAPAFDFARRWGEWLGHERVEAWKKSGFLRLYHYGEEREAEVSYRLLEDALCYEPYPRLTQPALVLHGLRDDVVPVEASECFVGAQRGATLYKLDSGHELLDVLDLLWNKTWAFVEGLGGESAGR